MKFPFGSRLSIYPLALLLLAANLRARQTAPTSAEKGPGVLRATKDLQADTNRVMPTLTTDRAPAGQLVVLIGTRGKSPLIDQLVRAKKLAVVDVAGKGGVLVEQLVDNPMPGVARALVIAGSDK